MVDVNTVKLREKLSFQLWDSDRVSVVGLPTMYWPAYTSTYDTRLRMIC